MEKIELRRSWQFLLITKKLAILCHPLKLLKNLSMDSQCLNPVQLGYGGYCWAGWLPYAKLIIQSPWLCLLSMLYVRVLLFTMDDMTVIKYGHRSTLREHPMKVAELVVKS